MNIQTKRRIEIMKELLEVGKALEIGIASNRLTNGKTLDCIKDYNPDYLCDLNNEAIPVDDESFDIIIAGEVLEHLQNPYVVVQEFYRVLRKGGCVIISVPNICSLINRIRMLFGGLPSYSCIPLNFKTVEKHINDFNLKMLIEVLEQANFKIEIITRSASYE